MSGDENSCREVLELLTDYLERALAPVVDSAVARHLDGCVGCRRYLDQFTVSIAATGRLGEDSVPADVRDR